LIYINKACQHYLNRSGDRIPSGQASDWSVAHCWNCEWGSSVS